MSVMSWTVEQARRVPTAATSGVVFPWPPRELNPNGRAHWAAKARSAKAYRHACWALAKEAKLVAPQGPIHVWLDFIPPSRRHHDVDNCVAAIKAGLDGLADALGVNDSRFVIHPALRDEIGGMVRVRIAEGP